MDCIDINTDDQYANHNYEQVIFYTGQLFLS
jgi:hypothetical protein